jgi:hypothetical protein
MNSLKVHTLLVERGGTVVAQHMRNSRLFQSGKQLRTAVSRPPAGYSSRSSCRIARMGSNGARPIRPVVDELMTRLGSHQSIGTATELMPGASLVADLRRRAAFPKRT